MTKKRRFLFFVLRKGMLYFLIEKRSICYMATGFDCIFILMLKKEGMLKGNAKIVENVDFIQFFVSIFPYSLLF